MMTSHLCVHELLEQHFDTAFAAPDGIKKLRELILTLAMQGKLVEQDPNDPPASELLKAIEAEKQRLQATSSPRRRGSSAGKNLDSRVRGNDGMKIKSLPPIKPEEVPYELPRGWEWVRLGEIGQTQTGTTPKSSDNSSYGADIPFIKPADITASSVDYCNEGLSISGVEKYGRLAPAGSSLMVCIGTIGKTNIINRNCSFNQQINAVTPYKLLFPSYIQQFIRSSFFQTECWKQSSSTTIAILNKGKWESIPVALPPLPEQHRIVAKIDQLMAKCDELEKLRKEREEKRRAVHAAAVKQLLDNPLSFPRKRESSRMEELDHRSVFVRGQSCGDDEKGLGSDGNPASGWGFIQQHFGELYTVKENVAELRKAILQLAVMGRLVPQDPNDPPASELLKAIQAEKQQLVKDGKIKQPKPLQPIKPEEVPYELPDGWEWVRLQIILDVRDGTHDSPKDAVGFDTYPMVTSKNFSNGRIDFSDVRMISAKDHFEISKRSKVECLDILFSMIGGNIGNQVIVQEEREFSIKNVALFKYYSKELTYPYFIKRFMECLATDLQQKAVGGAQPFISLGFLRNLVIGLPPAREQHRIVAKIDHLMALCDKLEQQIDATTGKQTELLNAVMAQV